MRHVGIARNVVLARENLEPVETALEDDPVQIAVVTDLKRGGYAVLCAYYMLMRTKLIVVLKK